MQMLLSYHKANLRMVMTKFLIKNWKLIYRYHKLKIILTHMNKMVPQCGVKMVKKMRTKGIERDVAIKGSTGWDGEKNGLRW